jgi:hypothetical protein
VIPLTATILVREPTLLANIELANTVAMQVKVDE